MNLLQSVHLKIFTDILLVAVTILGTKDTMVIEADRTLALMMPIFWGKRF